MRKIIDMWRPQGATSRESVDLAVQPNTYLPFQVQYFEQYGAASLRLEWSVNGGAFTIIPAESFYMNNAICSLINPDISIVKSIAPTIINMNWSPYNFSSYANWNCPCFAFYRLIYSYNNILSMPSGVNSAQNCPTYCNPSLTYTLNMSNISTINNISNLKLILQVSNDNITWRNSQCQPLQVSNNQSNYTFNCLTSQS
jgi:hypothetical protein